MGTTVWWRFTTQGGAWRYGYVTPVGHGLIRVGIWHGDTTRGPVVSVDEIETKPYTT